RWVLVTRSFPESQSQAIHEGSLQHQVRALYQVIRTCRNGGSYRDCARTDRILSQVTAASLGGPESHGTRYSALIERESIPPPPPLRSQPLPLAFPPPPPRRTSLVAER